MYNLKPLAQAVTLATAAAIGAAAAQPVRVTAKAAAKATARITVQAQANPKAQGSKSAARFALYKTGQTVAAYVAACTAAGYSNRAAAADIAWDSERGFIQVA